MWCRWYHSKFSERLWCKKVIGVDVEEDVVNLLREKSSKKSIKRQIDIFLYW